MYQKNDENINVLKVIKKTITKFYVQIIHFITTKY